MFIILEGLMLDAVCSPVFRCSKYRSIEFMYSQCYHATVLYITTINNMITYVNIVYYSYSYTCY